eukprot:PITA_32924
MKKIAPDVIFIEETKCSIQKIKEIHNKWLNRYEFLEVKAEHTAGGILTLWNPNKLDILDAEASREYLSVVIQPIGDKETYLVTNFYGPQRLEGKLKFLDSLEAFRDRHLGIPWILGGDFNMIKSLSEKKVGTKVLSKDYLKFQTFTDIMKLVDIVTSNGIFTWNNKRGGESQVASKLDRFMISKDLMLNNKEISARILPLGGSDHWSVHLEVQIIEDLNIQGIRTFLLQKRLKHIKLRLKDWNKNEHGNIFEAKKVVEGKMQELNQALITNGFDETKNDKATKCNQDWYNFCKQEEIFWRQKSRVQWLKEGERNTRFFHRSTMANKVHNIISVIKDEGGNLHNSHAEIE